MKPLFTIFLFLVFSAIMIAQTPTDKNKLYNQFLKDKANQIKKTGNRLDYLVIEFMDSLRKEGVDTIGIYQINYDGFHSFDTCSFYSNLAITVQWLFNGLYYHKDLISRCNNSTIQLAESSIISFYQLHQSSIDTSHILDALTSIEGDLMTILFSSHDIKYHFYCEINGKKYYSSFRNLDLTSEQGMFYEENQASIINQWKKYIEEQLKKL